jgi:hypothetical protein
VPQQPHKLASPLISGLESPSGRPQLLFTRRPRSILRQFLHMDMLQRQPTLRQSPMHRHRACIWDLERLGVVLPMGMGTGARIITTTVIITAAAMVTGGLPMVGMATAGIDVSPLA